MKDHQWKMSVHNSNNPTEVLIINIVATTVLLNIIYQLNMLSITTLEHLRTI